MPLGEFIINYDYIVNKLCVNKNKPGMHCNGKCYLKKELSKYAAKETSEAEKKAAEDNPESIAILPIVTEFCLKKNVIYTHSVQVLYTLQHYNFYFSDIFKPPRKVV